jgi:hypothetical protein
VTAPAACDLDVLCRAVGIHLRLGGGLCTYLLPTDVVQLEVGWMMESRPFGDESTTKFILKIELLHLIFYLIIVCF